MEEILKLGIVALVSGIGAYFGAYLKKKAENLATHEDIDKVLDQVRAVTSATKEIEAKISVDVWDRQKRWELKRDILFEAAKRLSEVDSSIISLNSVMQLEHEEPGKRNLPGFLQQKDEEVIRWRKAYVSIEETQVLLRIVCGQEVQEAFDAFLNSARGIALESMKGNVDIYGRYVGDLKGKSIEAKNAIRKELGIDVPN